MADAQIASIRIRPQIQAETQPTFSPGEVVQAVVREVRPNDQVVLEIQGARYVAQLKQSVQQGSTLTLQVESASPDLRLKLLAVQPPTSDAPASAEEAAAGPQAGTPAQATPVDAAAETLRAYAAATNATTVSLVAQAAEQAPAAPQAARAVVASLVAAGLTPPKEMLAPIADLVDPQAQQPTVVRQAVAALPPKTLTAQDLTRIEALVVRVNDQLDDPQTREALQTAKGPAPVALLDRIEQAAQAKVESDPTLRAIDQALSAVEEASSAPTVATEAQAAAERILSSLTPKNIDVIAQEIAAMPPDKREAVREALLSARVSQSIAKDARQEALDLVRRIQSAPPRAQSAPAQQAESPTQQAELPAQPADSPTQPANLPAQQANLPAQQANLPAQPANLPAQPANLPAQPANLPAQQANLPAQPADLPAQQANLPAQQANLPTQPANLPAQQANLPAQPADLPAQQANLPTQPANLPAQQANLPAQPADLPAQQANLPTQPANLPAQQANLPAQQANLPAQQADLSTQPAKTPAQQAPVPAQQVQTPAQQADLSTQPAKTPAQQAPVPAQQVQTPAQQAPVPTQQAQTPAQQVQTPAQQAPAPTQQVQAPAQPAQASTQQVQAPAQPAQTPAQQAPAPAQPAQTPAQQAPAPVQPVQAPVQPVQAQTQPAQAPVQPVQAPVQPAQASTQQVQAPVQPVQAPTQPAQAQTEPAQAQTQQAQAPVQPAQAQTQPAQAPTQQVQAPAQPAQAQTQPAQAPTQQVQAPAQPAQAQTQPAQAPVQPVQARTQQVQAPVQPAPAPEPRPQQLSSAGPSPSAARYVAIPLPRELGGETVLARVVTDLPDPPVQPPKTPPSPGQVIVAPVEPTREGSGGTVTLFDQPVRIAEPVAEMVALKIESIVADLRIPTGEVQDATIKSLLDAGVPPTADRVATVEKAVQLVPAPLAEDIRSLAALLLAKDLPVEPRGLRELASRNADGVQRLATLGRLARLSEVAGLPLASEGGQGALSSLGSRLAQGLSSARAAAEAIPVLDDLLSMLPAPPTARPPVPELTEALFRELSTLEPDARTATQKLLDPARLSRGLLGSAISPRVLTDLLSPHAEAAPSSSEDALLQNLVGLLRPVVDGGAGALRDTLARAVQQAMSQIPREGLESLAQSLEALPANDPVRGLLLEQARIALARAASSTVDKVLSEVDRAASSPAEDMAARVKEALDGADRRTIAAVRSALAEKERATMAATQGLPELQSLYGDARTLFDRLGALKLMDVATLSRDEKSLHFQLPLLVDGQVRSAQLRVTYRERGGEDGRPSKYEMTGMILRVEMSRLGPVTSKVDVRGDGLSVVFRVETPRVKALLESGRSDLEAALAKLGREAVVRVALAGGEDSAPFVPPPVRALADVDVRA